MIIDLDSALTIIGALISVFISVATSVWWFSQIEKHIQFSIKNLGSRFDVFETSYQEQKQHQDYVIHGLDKKIDHKGDRLMAEIKELEKELKELKKS